MAFTVYISNTFKDLHEYQQVAREAISRMGMIPMHWEDFGILDNYDFGETITRKMREAHVFVGIYAHHYGYIYEQHGVSVQEFEYNCAIEHNLPCLLFFVPDDATWPVDHVDRGENAKKLQGFREKLRDVGVINYFTTPDQFRAKLYLGLQHVLTAKQEREGILTIEPVFGSPSKQPEFQCDIFMVMPFAEEFTSIYRDYIVPAAEDLKLTIKRGDDFFSEHSIIEEIWSAICASSLVIADCTGKNANVFYELGIAHAIGKTAIMLTQNVDDTPFDLRHLRLIQYDTSPGGLKILSQQLRTAITRLL